MEVIEEQYIRPINIEEGLARMKADTKRRCPECGGDMKRWFIPGGGDRWECSECGYGEV